MTFYNIIFGLLFIGAFREVIYALGEGPDWRLFCLTATLSVLVFSDTIFTTVVIEEKKYEYSIRMKLLDLCSFILLSFAVVVLNPAKNDMFEVDVTNVLETLVGGTGLQEALFWGLLTLYMANLAIWNNLLGMNRVKCYWWVKWVQPVMALSFAAMAAMAWGTAKPEAPSWIVVQALHYLRWVVLFAVVAYLLRFKMYLSKVLDEMSRPNCC
jgi:hypothetical protein